MALTLKFHYIDSTKDTLERRNINTSRFFFTIYFALESGGGQ